MCSYEPKFPSHNSPQLQSSEVNYEMLDEKKERARQTLVVGMSALKPITEVKLHPQSTWLARRLPVGSFYWWNNWHTLPISVLSLCLAMTAMAKQKKVQG